METLYSKYDNLDLISGFFKNKLSMRTWQVLDFITYAGWMSFADIKFEGKKYLTVFACGTNTPWCCRIFKNRIDDHINLKNHKRFTDGKCRYLCYW